MTTDLDLADIQGNIIQDFVSGFPAARFVFLHVKDPEQGRAFVLEYRAKVTTALRWASSGAYVQKIQATKPDVAINIAFTFAGFLALGLPTRTLARMPPEFIDGMKVRAPILGDEDNKSAEDGTGQCETALLKWDPIWGERVHIMIGLNAGLDENSGGPIAALEVETAYLQALCAKHGIAIVPGHGKNNAPWQDGCAILEKTKATYKPVPREHFGFIDGISNPVFEGQFGDPQADAIMAIGNGKILDKKPDGAADSRWAPLATGEILLGHPDEAQETADMAPPDSVMRNGTFLVYRKLHENIASFNNFFNRASQEYAKANNVSQTDACLILKAKMAGRWPDGVSVEVAPTIAEWNAFNAKYANKDLQLSYVDFTYGDDPQGLRCPVASHMRRTNTRDSLTGKSSALNNRRRILRRGLPYGKTANDDDGEHGIIFLAMCASISRQFEFVQQQWINYGLDSNAGNDTCPIAGNRKGDAKFIVPVDPGSDAAPFICADIPQFVETRGGDYFFLPSMTALRMIGMGTVDPT
jgi:Dyp-type peroxidase family